MASPDLQEYLSRKSVPRELPSAGRITEAAEPSPVRIKGVLQAGNDDQVFISNGSIVFGIPADSILHISDDTTDSITDVELIVDANYPLQSSFSMLLRNQGDAEMPLALRESGAEFLITESDEDIDESVLRKLHAFGEQVPTMAAAQTTYSYMSSATSRPTGDGGYTSDSDPIRTADD